MGLKESGLRGSLRSVSTDVGIPDSVVDDFERSDPLNDYSGDVGDFSIDTSSPLEESASLSSTADSQERIFSATGLVDEATPQRGDQFSCLYRSDTTQSRGQIGFGAEDIDNNYVADIRQFEDKIAISKRESGGGPDILESSPFELSQGDVIECEITWHSDDLIEFKVYEFDTSNFERVSEEPDAEVSVTDGSFSDADGIVFAAAGSTGNSAHTWDFYIIRKRAEF